jgi:hypothetical protein
VTSSRPVEEERRMPRSRKLACEGGAMDIISRRCPEVPGEEEVSREIPRICVLEVSVGEVA